MSLETHAGPGRSALLQGWGRGEPVQTRLVRPGHPDEVAEFLGGALLIARGAGRSYGESAVSSGVTIDMRRCDRLLAYDPQTKVLTAEAGALLKDVIGFSLQRGAFVPVVPGTALVTLGGMIAADVHGKNHHRAGSLRQHVAWIDLLGPDGKTRRLTPDMQLFQSTIGGMGLTGIILRAALVLVPVTSGYLKVATAGVANLAELLSVLTAAEDHEYAVAWMDPLARGDNLGRGYVLSADHLDHGTLPPALRNNPFALPMPKAIAVPNWTPSLPAPFRSVMRLVNAAHLKGATSSRQQRILPWHRFFFPLDRVSGWNRLLGRKGFVQVHLLWPEAVAPPSIVKLLELIDRHRLCPSLAVLKRMRGVANTKYPGLSFSDAGISLAIDLPRSPRLLAAFAEISALAEQDGARFYLAKDALLDGASLRRTDPRAEGFSVWRREQGLSSQFASRQSERLGL